MSLVDVINTKSGTCGMLELPDGGLLTDYNDWTLKRWYFDADIIGNTIFTPRKCLCSWMCLPNKIIVFGGENGDLEFRDLDTMKLVAPVIQGRKSKIYHLAYQNCLHLIIIDSDFYLTCWYLDAFSLNSMTKLEFEACSLAVYGDGSNF